jgi:broad specificity phosphatase PhoE
MTPAEPGGTCLLLARHGQTADNAGGLILGRRDPPLSELGMRQAAELAGKAREAKIAIVWSSPLQRARTTAERVVEATGVPMRIVGELAESDRGDWEGRRVAELEVAEPVAFAAFVGAAPDFQFPGGESLAHQVARTRHALDLAADGPHPALVVAHVGTIRAAMIATGMRPPPEAAIPHAELIEIPWSRRAAPS